MRRVTLVGVLFTSLGLSPPADDALALASEEDFHVAFPIIVSSTRMRCDRGTVSLGPVSGRLLLTQSDDAEQPGASGAMTLVDGIETLPMLVRYGGSSVARRQSNPRGADSKIPAVRTRCRRHSRNCHWHQWCWIAWTAFSAQMFTTCAKRFRRDTGEEEISWKIQDRRSDR